MLSDFSLAWQLFSSKFCPRFILVCLDDHQLYLQEWRPGRHRPFPTWQLRLPKGVCQDGCPVDVEALGDLIGEFLLDQGIVGAHILAVLPPACSGWRVLSGAQESRLVRRLDQGALSWLAPQESFMRLPLALDEAEITLCDLPGCPDLEVLVASSRKSVNAWIEVFATAGVSLQRLMPAQLCWMDALLPLLNPSEPSKLTVLVSVGPGDLRMIAWCGVEPIFQDSAQLDKIVEGSWLDRRFTFLLQRFAASEIAVFMDGALNLSVSPWPGGVIPTRLGAADGFANIALYGLACAELNSRC